MSARTAAFRPALPTEWPEILRLRIAVFVHEQGGPLSDEPDGWDAEARHFVVVCAGRVVGTARLYHPETAAIAKVGRIALLPEARGRGWGAALVNMLVESALEAGCRAVVLDAQTHALGFYERLGFVAEGAEFMDAGLPHRRMRLALR